MNKSMLTNILALALIALSYLSPLYKEQILAMGLFSFSGAITNWLAIHMLFEKVPFLYGSGIVTERFEEFKLGIKNLLMNQFFTKDNFEKFMNSTTSNAIRIEEDALLDAIDFDKIFNKLKQAIVESPFGSMLGMFGGEQALDPLKPAFEVKFKESIQDIIQDEKFIKSLSSSGANSSVIETSILSIVNQRLDELTPLLVKNIIQEMIREHLGWLVVWGGVFGGLIGLLSTLI